VLGTISFQSFEQDIRAFAQGKFDVKIVSTKRGVTRTMSVSGISVSNSDCGPTNCLLTGVPCEFATNLSIVNIVLTVVSEVLQRVMLRILLHAEPKTRHETTRQLFGDRLLIC
jgi:hypothetical protein